jgi:hypothetical protein
MGDLDDGDGFDEISKAGDRQSPDEAFDASGGQLPRYSTSGTGSPVTGRPIQKLENQRWTDHLDPSEERDVIRLAKAGDPEAKERLFRCFNKGLRKIAGNVKYGGPPFAEKLSAARVGLFEALKGYDPKRNNKFWTYARKFVVGVIPRGADGSPLPPQAVMESLLSAHHALETHPAAAIAWLAQSYGVDLGQLAYDPAAEAQRQQVTTQHQQAMQQLQHQYQQLQAQHQHWHNQRLQYLQNQILDYAKDKAHWPEIENEVYHQIAAIRDQRPGLYEIDPMAVLKEAEKRALSITGVNERRSAAENKRKADDAKRLASINMKTGGMSRSPSNVGRDMWSGDTWTSAYDRATRR